MIKIRIGIISDTHLSKNMDKLKSVLSNELSEVDVLIHAGDYKSTKVIDILKNHKKFIGVYGNGDDSRIREQVKEKEIIHIDGYTLGIYHGHGGKKDTLETAYEKFSEDNVDIIIFGHSHLPIIKTKNKVLMLNPGSITCKRKERWHSFIILTLNKTGISAEMKFLNKL